MPPLSSEVISLMSSITAIFVQMVKGLVPEKVKQYIPLILFFILVPLGVLLALYTGRDPVSGALEGLFGFASAVGFYETASRTPGVKAAFNGRGWINRK